jgi:hypothetical protein
VIDRLRIRTSENSTLVAFLVIIRTPFLLLPS